MKIFQTPVGFFEVNTKKEILEFVKERYKEVKPKDVIEVDQLPENESMINLGVFLSNERKLNKVLKTSKWLLKEEPTRSFNIGDPVAYGRYNEFKVVGVYDDKKVYHISDGKNERFLLWVDVLPYVSAEDDAKKPVFRVDDELFLSYSNTSLESFFTKLYYFGVDMDPSYQRELEWSLEQKVLLIDSILKDLDIGKFVFVNHEYVEDGYMESILDGKQRLNAIKEFYEDRFTYRGLKYSELSQQDRNRFINKSVSYATIQGKHTEKEIVKYFLRLNQGGVPVSKEHLDAIAKKYDFEAF